MILDSYKIKNETPTIIVADKKIYKEEDFSLEIVLKNMTKEKAKDVIKKIEKIIEEDNIEQDKYFSMLLNSKK